MRKRSDENHPERFLSLRGGVYQYYRRIPSRVAHLDSRAPYVRITLKTGDIRKAMALRDIYEKADNEFWASLVLGSDHETALAQYKTVVAHATALGFTYRTTAEIIAKESTEQIVQRVEAAAASRHQVDRVAILGLVEGADMTMSKAIEFYFDEIVPDQLRTKSADQRRRWKNKRLASVNTFIDICGDKALSQVSREDAQKVYRHWMQKIAPASGTPTHSPSTGNREMGNLRSLYEDWFKFFGVEEFKNPFDGLSFVEKKSGKRKRPPFSVKWISDKFLKPGALARMNREYRMIFFTLIETGARLSEIINLRPENIVLDHEFPHITIEPCEDPDDPREIKTMSSIRTVPLIGVALEAMRQYPDGFPDLRDKGSAVSNAINKFMRENGLCETPRHKVYSLRHAFEDRMKDGNLDSELRMMLMGHAIDRPDYGSGGSLKWRYNELKKIELPYDPEILQLDLGRKRRVHPARS